MESYKLRPDVSMRKKLFVPDAFKHPAKMHLEMLQMIVERYTQPGETILDPMAGIGTTLLAALMGRNVICVELEPHFITPMKASWAKMQQHGPMLGCEMGQAVIVRGDARMLPIASADHIVTSPPYEGSLSLEQNGIDEAKLQHSFGPNSQFARPQVYTRPIDAVVSSPPYEGSLEGSAGIRHHKNKSGSFMLSVTRKGRSAVDLTYDGASENIGNQRGQAYWDSMRQVYSECHRVLRPNGVMVLVLKGFTRDGKYVDLPAQTAELVESLGFRQFDHWKRELWSLSFWRILQKRRDPAAFDNRLLYEEVLAFRKEELDGVA